MQKVDRKGLTMVDEYVYSTHVYNFTRNYALKSIRTHNKLGIHEGKVEEVPCTDITSNLRPQATCYRDGKY